MANLITVKTTELPAIELSQIESAYVGKPDMCRCGCAGAYTYTKASAKLAGKDRGYKVNEEEINDARVQRIINKMKKFAHLGIEVLDGHIFTLQKGSTEYSLYLNK